MGKRMTIQACATGFLVTEERFAREEGSMWACSTLVHALEVIDQQMTDAAEEKGCPDSPSQPASS